MTFYTRGSWGARPSARPLYPFVGQVRGVVIHWNGPPVARTQRPADVVRSTQRFHMDTRHWRDIAYNLGVDWNGDVWEARGLEYRNGAHDNDIANDHYIAIEVMTGEGQAITPAIEAGVRNAIALARMRWPDATEITPHSQWTATACPGDELRERIELGTFDPAPAPLPFDDGEDDDMTKYVLVELNDAAVKQRVAPTGIYLVVGGRKFPVTTPDTVEDIRKAGLLGPTIRHGEAASRNFLDNHP